MSWSQNSRRMSSSPELEMEKSIASLSSNELNGDAAESKEPAENKKKINGSTEGVYDLLEMLRGNEGCKDINAFLLSMSSAIDICLAMKQSGCLPLLIKLINARGQDMETKEITSQVFHNIIQATADKSTEQPETRIYNLLEQLRDYCQMLRSIPETENPAEDVSDQPVDYSKKYSSERNTTLQTRESRDSDIEPLDYSMKYKKKGSSSHQDNLNSEESVQPIDYSKRFSEPSCALRQKNISNEGQIQPIDYSTRYLEKISEPEIVRSPKKDPNSNSEEDVFGDYAETDLDQPTDYSLRYAEDDTDEDEKQNSGYFAENEQVFVPEDTVKTYCTEGTPYETPFNFSTATSMSDLRVDDAKDTEVPKKILTKNVEIVEKDDESTFAPSIEESDIQIVANNDSEIPKNVSELSSDQVSPEKSDNYCEEVVDKEGKMVTFGGEDHYAEQTPLMFSRCSSLGSLGGFEQHSIHDDRSSVVSDFSWRTSGIVSPSELPDSPTQTIPPSPRHHKSQSEFSGRSQDEASKLPAHRLLNGRSNNATKRSVFEDDVAGFKEESTPIEFSAATSLSSLTIDDEPKISSDSKIKENSERLKASIPEEIEEHPSSAGRIEPKNEIEAVEEVDADSEEGEDDEGMLAACINIGMQSIINRNEEQKTPVKNTETEDIDETVNTDQETDGDEDDEDMLAACINIGMHSTFRNRKEDQKGSVTSEVASVTEAVDNEEISDVDDDEGMLAACINIGMQRVLNRQDDPKANLKPEILSTNETEDSNKMSDVDSEGEDMLTACINIGIQSTHGQSLRRNNHQKPSQPVTNLTRYQTSSALNHLDGGVKSSLSGSQIPGLRSLKNGQEDAAVLDSLHIYCTEDTPANISPAGSHSNLSALSVLSSPGIADKNCDSSKVSAADGRRSDLFSIDRLTLSEDDDVIVAKLIQSGMQKVQLNGNPSPSMTLSVSKKTNMERACSTPSTSPAEPVYDSNKKDISRPESPEHEIAEENNEAIISTIDCDLRSQELRTAPSPSESRCSIGDFVT